MKSTEIVRNPTHLASQSKDQEQHPPQHLPHHNLPQAINSPLTPVHHSYTPTSPSTRKTNPVTTKFPNTDLKKNKMITNITWKWRGQRRKEMYTYIHLCSIDKQKDRSRNYYGSKNVQEKNENIEIGKKNLL